MRIICLFLLAMSITSAHAADPLYMSLRSNKINMRVGPGKMYPILWTYTMRGLPVRIIDRHNDWVQIQDEASETGWVYDRLLSTTRTAMTATDDVFLRRHPDNNAGIIARLMKYVVVIPRTCRTTWCNVTLSHKGDVLKGWMRKSVLWGIDAQDVFEEE